MATVIKICIVLHYIINNIINIIFGKAGTLVGWLGWHESNATKLQSTR